MTRALLVAGDSRVPVGPFDSSLALLETGLLEAHGIRSIGIAGYPEAHPRIAAARARRRARPQARLRGGERHRRVHRVAVLLRPRARSSAGSSASARAGSTVPVRVGVAGIATIRTLLDYARRCGIGNSIRALGAEPISLPRLLTQQGPEKLVRRLAASPRRGRASPACTASRSAGSPRPRAGCRRWRRGGSGSTTPASSATSDPRRRVATRSRVPFGAARGNKEPDHDPTHDAAVPRRPRRQLPPAQGAARRSRAGPDGRDLPRRAPQSRGRGDPRRREVPGGARPAGDHRRRVPAHVLPHRLPRAARRGRDARRHHRQVPRQGRRRELRAAGDARDGQGPPRAGDPAGRLRVPAVGDEARAEGDDPLADHAALPRRACGDQQGGLSRPRGVLRRRRGGVPRRAEAARRTPAAGTSSSTTPTSPTCATRSCARARSRAATTPTSCRAATRS